MKKSETHRLIMGAGGAPMNPPDGAVSTVHVVVFDDESVFVGVETTMDSGSDVAIVATLIAGLEVMGFETTLKKNNDLVRNQTFQVVHQGEPASS